MSEARKITILTITMFYENVDTVSWEDQRSQANIIKRNKEGGGTTSPVFRKVQHSFPKQASLLGREPINRKQTIVCTFYLFGTYDHFTTSSLLPGPAGRSMSCIRQHGILGHVCRHGPMNSLLRGPTLTSRDNQKKEGRRWHNLSAQFPGRQINRCIPQHQCQSPPLPSQGDSSKYNFEPFIPVEHYICIFPWLAIECRIYQQNRRDAIKG